MGTKNNPGRFDCYASAHPDEPNFVLLGRDPFGGALVRLWAEVRKARRPGDPKIASALETATEMDRWCKEEAQREVEESVLSALPLEMLVEELRRRGVDGELTGRNGLYLT